MVLASPLFAQDAVRIGMRRELFVDDGLIERVAGRAELRLHHPIPRRISVVNDLGWEGNGTNYVTVFHDGEKYLVGNGVPAEIRGEFQHIETSATGVRLCQHLPLTPAKPIGIASEFSAQQGIARILTRRGEFDEALKTLQRAQPDNFQGVWRTNIQQSIDAVNKAHKP
jgi:hypothetical protein